MRIKKDRREEFGAPSGRYIEGEQLAVWVIDDQERAIREGLPQQVFVDLLNDRAFFDGLNNLIFQFLWNICISTFN